MGTMSATVATIPQILAIVGPTASGKSAAAMAVAQAAKAEIIACDSVQVYRGFTIGAAKPTAEEQALVRHHLVDVAEADEPFDAQQYVDLAQQALADIRSRGKTALVCGGTGLYLRALRYGLADAPTANPALRAELMAQEAAEPGALVRRLAELDPASAAQIDPRNGVHVLRALEITLQAGEPASAIRARHGFAQERVPMRIVALTWTDVALKRRIVERTTQMLRAGLMDEVRGLLRAGVSPTCRPMRAVGYKEAVAVVEGRIQERHIKSHIVQSTWQYARRQRTWLRREASVLHLETDSPESASRYILQQVVHTA